MTEPLRLEIEVPGTPEEVWEAIATGPGISAWWLPAEIEGDAVTYHHGPDMSSEGTVTASEPPSRFVVQEGDGATEFLVEARAGGTCVVRLVASGFADEGARDGWTAALLSLRLYMEHFPGQEAANLVAGGTVEGPDTRAWAELLVALGIDEPAEGDRIAATGGPPLAGVVEGTTASSATVRIDEPGPGLAFVGVGGPSEDWAFAFVRLQVFGDDREAIVARDEAAWHSLLSERLTKSTAAG